MPPNTKQLVTVAKALPSRVRRKALGVPDGALMVRANPVKHAKVVAKVVARAAARVAAKADRAVARAKVKAQ